MTRAVGSCPRPGGRHALTRLGGEIEGRIHFRRDAICPALAMLSVRHFRETFVVTGQVINICETGCLLASDRFPWRDDVLDDGRVEGAWFPRIAQEIRLLLPWTGTLADGLVRRQGNYTLHVDFSAAMPARLVDRIAAMNPAPGPAREPDAGPPAAMNRNQRFSWPARR